ncbi:MAG: dienelactone hydrolase family protein [Elusimicrobiota bacterium]|nr:MAG: dienelactone hydrolase family protein [Elusimicrobiota bacterium]
MTLGKPSLVRRGNLDAIELSSGKEGALTVVCLHGYGADMRDLAPLAQEIETQRPVDWLFPDAPETLDWGGRAWFPIDVQAFEEAQRTGKPRDLSLKEPEGMSWAREELQKFIAELAVPWNRLVLMGFSQGAMLAVDLAAQAPEPPAGVAILSGTLVNKAPLAELAAKKKGLPFFMSHGSVDPILGFPQARALEKVLVEAGWRGQLQRFEGGHGIPPEVLYPLGRWLDKR